MARGDASVGSSESDWSANFDQLKFYIDVIWCGGKSILTGNSSRILRYAPSFGKEMGELFHKWGDMRWRAISRGGRKPGDHEASVGKRG